jgi:hypothetical protein
MEQEPIIAKAGKALFDMHFETTVASLGGGLLRFNDIGFLAIDILRLQYTGKAVSQSG